MVEAGCLPTTSASDTELPAIQFIPQVVSRITYFLPVYDRINCKSVTELFDDIADECIFDMLCLAPFSRYLLDLKSLVNQLEQMVERRCRNFAQKRLASSITEKYKSFVLDIVESNTLTNLTAFYVNAGNDEASVRLRDVVNTVCSSNANTIERFGCLNFLVDHPISSSRLHSGNHLGSFPGREVFTYAEVIGWFKSMPHLSVLYLSSMDELNSSRWDLEDDEAAAVHREKMAHTWAPLAADKAPQLENLRQLHFFENSSAIESFMVDFVRPLSQVELVTLPETSMYQNVDDFVAIKPKLRTLFPNAVILPRAVRFCLSSLLSLYMDDGEPGKTAEECEAILQNMVHAVQKAAASGLRPVSLSVHSSDLHALASLNLLPSFDSLLETLSRTSYNNFELVVNSTEKLTWAELRNVLQFWTMRSDATPRPRGSRFRINFFEDITGNDQGERDAVDAEEVVANIFEPPVAVAEPADVVNNEGVDVPADVAENSRSVQECLKTLWRTLDATKTSNQMHDHVFADAYYADIVRKRFSWLLTSHEFTAADEDESVSGGLLDMGDGGLLDVDNFDDYNDYDDDYGGYYDYYEGDENDNDYDGDYADNVAENYA